MKSLKHKIYKNEGNKELLHFMGALTGRILDVGCGAGDNARLWKKAYPGIKIYGVTLSAKEKERAQRHLDQCIIANVEDGIPKKFENKTFNAIVFSHVLEHLCNPPEVLKCYSQLLAENGKMYVAIPNIAVWRQRLQLLLGKFEYEDTGLLDRTHLRFYTYHTAVDELFNGMKELEVESKQASGHFPLGPARNILPQNTVSFIDKKVIQTMPNLFGNQILISAGRIRTD